MNHRSWSLNPATQPGGVNADEADVVGHSWLTSVVSPSTDPRGRSRRHPPIGSEEVWRGSRSRTRTRSTSSRQGGDKYRPGASASPTRDVFRSSSDGPHSGDLHAVRFPPAGALPRGPRIPALGHGPDFDDVRRGSLELLADVDRPDLNDRRALQVNGHPTHVVRVVGPPRAAPLKPQSSSTTSPSRRLGAVHRSGRSCNWWMWHTLASAHSVMELGWLPRSACPHTRGPGGHLAGSSGRSRSPRCGRSGISSRRHPPQLATPP